MPSDPYEDLEEPSRRNLTSEIRSLGEIVRLATNGKRLLRNVPQGNGELVIVYPGYGMGDTATAPLRAFLTNRGFSTRGWRLGRNHGDVEKLLPQVFERLQYELHFHTSPTDSDAPKQAFLVGWSLGGVFAREIARDHPELVRRVITFGTPVVGGPKYTVSASSYRDRGIDVEDIAAKVAERNRTPITVPITAIFSKSDGVVNWQACVDHMNDQVEHVEIDAPHGGMPINPDIFDLVATRLATSDADTDPDPDPDPNEESP